MGTEEVARCEDALREAMLASDADRLALLLHDDLVFTDQHGNRHTKEEDLATHRSGSIRIEAIDVDGREIRVVDDIAIVWLTATLAGMDAIDEPFVGTLAYTRVWQRAHGQWQVVTAHCSEMILVS